MIKYVIKRSDDRQPFRPFNVRRAIEKANAEVQIEEQATDEEIQDIISNLKKYGGEEMHVEAIQDFVQTSLMKYKHFELAGKYIAYRQVRALARQFNQTYHSILALLDGSNKELLSENSNKNGYTNSTQRDLMAGEVSKSIADQFILPPDILEDHLTCKIHYHDRDYAAQKMFNCCLINIKDMLDNGSVMNNTLIESPRSFRTACNVMTQFVANIASNQYGGQSVAIKHLGRYLAISRDKIRMRMKKRLDDTGIKYTEDQLNRVVEDMLQEELKDGVQLIQYQCISLMTTNGQSPFITLFLQIDDEDPYKNEVAMIVREIIRQRYEGIKNKDGVYVTPTFPKLVYVLDENTIEGGEFYDITQLCAKCNIKRSYPDYISAKKMRELHDGEVYSCMGCRSFLSEWKITPEYAKENGLPDSEIGKYKWEGRFNQGVVSINLPQIGIEADHDMDKFWLLLEDRLMRAHRALLFRHSFLEGTLSNSSPLHWQFGAIARLKVDEPIDKLLHGGYSTISLGYIGIYETVQAMLGISHTTEEGSKFALKIMKRLKGACDQWKEETGIGFGLYGTPAESLCYRFAKYDTEHYGVIKNVTDHDFYTNSYHVFVGERINAFEKFSFESQFQSISTGGCISYVEIPNLESNVDAVLQLINYIYDTIMYAEFNSKSDYCYVCGYDGEIKVNQDNEWECPCCHNKDQNKMIVTRRTCGYLGANFWNPGKTKEISQRVTHL